MKKISLCLWILFSLFLSKPASLFSQSFYWKLATSNPVNGVVSEPFCANAAVVQSNTYSFNVRKEPLEFGEYKWFIEFCTFNGPNVGSIKKYLIESSKPTGSYRIVKVMANTSTVDVFIQGGSAGETLLHFRFTTTGVMTIRRQIAWGLPNGTAGSLQINQVISGSGSGVYAMAGTVQLGQDPQRPLFMLYNALTGAVTVSKQYKISNDGQFGQESGLSGLSILRIGTSSYLIAGLADSDPYIMRVDANGNMQWIRRYTDNEDGMLGITYGTEAISNLRLFSAAYGTTTYYGLIMGSLAPQFRLIRFDLLTTGSVLDYQKIIVPSFSNVGIPAITDFDVFNKYLMCTYAERLDGLPNQTPAFASSFILYDLSNNESKVFSISDAAGQLLSSLPRMIDAQAALGNPNLFTITICGGSRNSDLPSIVQHDHALTEVAGGSIALTSFECYNEFWLSPEQSTAISIEIPYLLGTPVSSILNYSQSVATAATLAVSGMEICGSRALTADDRHSETANLNGQLEITPNPASDHVTINYNIDSNVSWVLYDCRGAVRASGNDTGLNKTIDTHDWNAGVYFLKLVANGEVHTEKFVVTP